MSGKITGGCQCGAVRFRLSGPLIEPALCHCRMCQKASGNLFMAMVGSMLENFALTRGEPSWFRSSSAFRRGFCGACGTPLFFQKIEGKGIGVALGSLDDPGSVPPVAAYGVQSRMPWLAEVCMIEGNTTKAEYESTPGLFEAVCGSGNQHPDHDTEAWPPESKQEKAT